jgi:NAD dependent epimerase/dehydratase family enzyme
MLKLIIGEAAEVVTSSQRINLKKLIDSDYKFKFENLEEALRNLLGQKKRLASRESLNK